MTIVGARGRQEEGHSMRFCVVGAPRTKKTSNRILRFGKFNKIVPSEQFIRWQNAAVPQLRIAWAGRTPITRVVNVRATFYRDAERGDAVGYYQALADVLQAAGVLSNDKQIVSWDNSRLCKDKDRPRVEFEIEVLTS